MTFNRAAILDPDNTSPLSNCSAISVSPGATGNGVSLAPAYPVGPQSLPADHNSDRHSYSAPDNQAREDFVFLAKNGTYSCLFKFGLRLMMFYLILVLSNLKTVAMTMSTERDRLRAALEAEANVQTMSITPANNGNYVSSLKASLNQALLQNGELKSRLNKVHELADLCDLSSVDPISETVCLPFHAASNNVIPH